ncbi:protein MALE DISCOVERER 2-like isoform X2 [Arachis hypogaea]|uniref:protein MALE DISCOVERER 2-like isoform X2 n=1 Tax=Arachis hypogaea TaxID=3818 RepID=UPI000DED2A07|nr:protein NSP-INTERACTING KINASE 3-like [Arachis hypogaea]
MLPVFLLMIKPSEESANFFTDDKANQVLTLMAIKNELNDPHNVLENWDSNSIDPCSWRMITCNLDGSVSVLGMPSQNLSGTLSPWVGNLTNLQSMLLQNNAISDQIATAIGSIEKLQTLDLSNNNFSVYISINGALYFIQVFLREGYYVEKTFKQTAEILKQRGMGLESQLDSLEVIIKDLQAETMFFGQTIAEAAVHF